MLAILDPTPPRRIVPFFRFEEAFALTYAGAVFFAFKLRGFHFSLALVGREYGKFLVAMLAVAIPFWLAARGLEARHGRVAWRGAKDDLLGLVRAFLPLLIVLIAYTHLKSRIAAFHPRLFDEELALLDAALHYGGGDFLGFLLGFTHDPTWSARWSAVYFFAWVALALPFGVAFARGGALAARRLTVALVLVYAAGSLVYLALPALGPAFAFRPRFAHLAGTTGFYIQESMLAAFLRLVRHPDSATVPFFGIAAFPSLHLATTALGLFAAGRWAKPLLLLLVPVNLAVVWSALYFGWHYAIDFYPAILLAWGGWWAAGKLLAPEPTRTMLV